MTCWLCGFGLLPGIGAVVCYFVQRRRRPTGMALAGLVTGLLAVVLSVLMLASGSIALLQMQPGLARARTRAYKSSDRGNLRNIGLCLAMFANDHQAYPESLAGVVEYSDSEEVLRSPADEAPRPVPGTGLLSSYEYVGALPKPPPAEAIVVHTRAGIFPDGRYVLYGDGAVKWVDENVLTGGSEPGPRDSLQASYELLMGRPADQVTPEMDERLREFYEVE